MERFPVSTGSHVPPALGALNIADWGRSIPSWGISTELQASPAMTVLLTPSQSGSVK
jgi:hypothetical protein